MSKPTNGDFFHQGRKVLRESDGTPGTITALTSDRFVITWDDGSEGCVLAASLEAADAAHIRALVSGKPLQDAAGGADAIIRAYQQKAAIGTATIKALATGLDPKSPTFGADVAALLKSGEVTLPEPTVKKDDSQVVSFQKHIEHVAKHRGTKVAGGNTIVMSHTHKRIGEPGAD
jgi:hypothetical protein